MRVISLCPSLTETVFALGRGADLVGITDWCVRPAAGVAAIERIGGTKTPRLERIVELAPDLVLLNEEENRREDAAALSAAGVRCHTSLPTSPQEVAATVRSLGAALDRAERAESLAGAIESALEQALAAAAGRPRLRYAYVIWRRPWMAVGPGTYVDALLAAAGGANILAARTERYPRIDPRELADGEPGAVLMASEPLPFREEHLDELASESGLPRERFRIVDGELLSWHGARTPQGLAYASTLVAELGG